MICTLIRDLKFNDLIAMRLNIHKLNYYPIGNIQIYTQMYICLKKLVKMCDVHFGSKLVSYFSNLSTCVFLVSQILSHRQNTFYTADWQRFSSSVICIMNPVVKFSILGHKTNYDFYKVRVSKIISCRSQCARTDLNKRFLPKPMTTTGWKVTP